MRYVTVRIEMVISVENVCLVNEVSMEIVLKIYHFTG